MTTRPDDFPRWAEDEVNDIREINGVPTVLPNKIEPTEEFKSTGERSRENLPREYLNFQFDLIDEWVQNLDERTSIIGTVYLTTATETAGSLATRFGGGWTAEGTATLGTLTGINIWERTT